MAYADKILPHYTYDDYCRWEGRWEIVEGIPYAMSPMPRPEHQRVAAKLNAVLINALDSAACDCTVYQPIDYKVSEDTILNPDLLIVCQPITKAFLDFPPCLVVEILSPATALKDRHTKFSIYQNEGIPYYIMIDADKRLVEVYHLQDGAYQSKEMDQLRPFTFSFNDCSFGIIFNEIWK